MAELFAGVEAGGTKFVCAMGTGPNDIRERVRIETRRPEETLGETIDFIKRYQSEKGEKIAAAGVACFGPVDLDRDSPTYGYITTTPKQGWQNTDVAGALGKALGVPVGFDTDVNGAALGEYTWGAGRNMNVLIYLTVGTGIGGGLLVDGKPVHGLLHTEMGHLNLPHDSNTDPFEGCCPYHKDCLEGLASGRAMDLRWHKHASELPDDHPGWQIEADYLASALCNYIYTVSPNMIILGGGLMKKRLLLDMVRQKVLEKLNNYINTPRLTENIQDCIASPGLGENSGIAGAFCLAIRELNKNVFNKKEYRPDSNEDISVFNDLDSGSSPE